MNIIQKILCWRKKSEPNQLTIEDAKKLWYKYRYAIVSNDNDKIYYLCKDYDSVKKTMEDIMRFNCYINYRIVDLCSA